MLVDHLGAPLSSTTPDRPPHGPAVAPEGVAALDRIVARPRAAALLAPGATSTRDALRADAETCVASLAGGAAALGPAPGHLVAAVRAHLRRRPRAPPRTVEARYGGVVDHVN